MTASTIATSLAVVGGVGGLLPLVGRYLATVFRWRGAPGDSFARSRGPRTRTLPRAPARPDVVRADQRPDPLSVAKAT